MYMNTQRNQTADYFLMFFKMKTEILGHEGNFNGFPKQMETEILRHISIILVGVDRIEAFIEDSDNRSG